MGGRLNGCGDASACCLRRRTVGGGAGNAIREFGSLTGSTAWAGVRAVVGSWQAQARSHCRWAFPARTCGKF